MGQPLTGFTHQHYRSALPPLDDGRERTRHPVLISGGGPVGMAVALALARHGIRSVVVEADDTVCIGSRAICLSRRTLEILDRLGALAPFLAKGLPWTGGRSFYRDAEVLHFHMPHDDDQRLAPMTNLQQYYIEQFLLDAVQAKPDLIEMRWSTSVAAVTQHADGVSVDLHAEGADYQVEAEYVVACDGARSAVRQALGLRMAGTSYEGRYVIADIEIELDLPTERLAWFDPPSAPGRTMLMHKQPDDLWRLDYQLHADEDSEVMVRPENVTPVIAAHLRMMGLDQPWRMVWISMYKAAAVSMERYRHGRVLFAGDAAHLVPIFGVRGLNGGFDDAFNLGWKLAYVLKGQAPADLLDSYSQERRGGWEVNIANAMKSTEFMAPPSRGFELMREAVLSLAGSHPALRALISPRQSSAISYDASPLNAPASEEAAFEGGPAPGQPIPEAPVQDAAGGDQFLTRMLSDDFTLLAFHDGTLPHDIAELDRTGGRSLPPPAIVGIGALPAVSGSLLHDLVDHRGRAAVLFDARPGTVYLVRPDGHVCGRWRRFAGEAVMASMRRACGDGR